MLKTVLAAVAAILLAQPAFAQSDAPEPIRVMIVGSWHFDNPGQDIHNVRSADMRTPERQAELAAVAEALDRFDPTVVGIERVARDQATLVDQGWAAYSPADLLTDPDERVQIGYRLADLAGIDRVYAIDEQPADGEDLDYFPYDRVMAFAEAHGRTAELEAMQGPVAAYVADLTARQQTDSVGAVLADINRPDHPFNGPAAQGFYYGFLRFGAGRDLPGADLNVGWYARNAKIFAKLLQVARPGDRVVVVFGSGHLYWLRHFVETMPGYELVEPSDYLTGL